MALIRRSDHDTFVSGATVLNMADIRAQAKMVEDQAAARAAEILRAAQQERERIIHGARDLGYAEGVRRGVEEGKAMGAAEAKSICLNESRSRLSNLESRWMTALAEFEAARETMLAEARKDLIRLSLRVAEGVLKRAVDTDPGIVSRQLEVALEMLTKPSRVMVAINPEDESHVRDSLPALMKKCQKAEHIELVIDPGLARGSCSVRTAGGEINAGIWTQIERIADGLLLGGSPADSIRGGAELSSSESRPEGEAS